tara:strand:- start:111 stop:548 length:438 start_codon:yes stop_codon:yes gene_type:complete
MIFKNVIYLLSLICFTIQSFAQNPTQKEIFISNHLIEQNKMVLLVNNNNLDAKSITYINDVQKTFENAFFNQIEGKGLTCYVLVDVNNDIRNFSLNYKSLPTSDFNSIFGNHKQNILINSAGEIIIENIAPNDLRISIANQLKRR